MSFWTADKKVFAALLTIQLLDSITTVIGLQRGIRESNSFVNSMFHLYHVYTPFLTGIITLSVLYLLWSFSKKKISHAFANVVTAFLQVPFAFATINNLMLIGGLK